MVKFSMSVRPYVMFYTIFVLSMLLQRNLIPFGGSALCKKFNRLSQSFEAEQCPSVFLVRIHGSKLTFLFLLLFSCNYQPLRLDVKVGKIFVFHAYLYLCERVLLCYLLKSSRCINYVKLLRFVYFRSSFGEAIFL